MLMPSTSIKTLIVLLPFLIPSYADDTPPAIRLWTSPECGSYRGIDWLGEIKIGEQQPFHYRHFPEKHIVKTNSFHLSRNLTKYQTLTFYSGPDKEHPCEHVVETRKGFLKSMKTGPDDDEGAHECYPVAKNGALVNATCFMVTERFPRQLELCTPDTCAGPAPPGP